MAKKAANKKSEPKINYKVDIPSAKDYFGDDIPGGKNEKALRKKKEAFLKKQKKA